MRNCWGSFERVSEICLAFILDMPEIHQSFILNLPDVCLFTFNIFDNPLFGLNELFGLNSVENFRIRFKRIIRLKSWIRFLIKGILKVNYSDSVKRNRNTVLDIFGSFNKKGIGIINYSYSYSFSYKPYSFEP